RDPLLVLRKPVGGREVLHVPGDGIEAVDAARGPGVDAAQPIACDRGDAPRQPLGRAVDDDRRAPGRRIVDSSETRALRGEPEPATVLHVETTDGRRPHRAEIDGLASLRPAAGKTSLREAYPDVARMVFLENRRRCDEARR